MNENKYVNSGISCEYIHKKADVIWEILGNFRFCERDLVQIVRYRLQTLKSWQRNFFRGFRLIKKANAFVVRFVCDTLSIGWIN